MDLATIQSQIPSWTPEEQDQLAAYLMVLRQRRKAEHADELARRSEDRTAENWLTFAELKDKLGED